MLKLSQLTLQKFGITQLHFDILEAACLAEPPLKDQHELLERLQKQYEYPQVIPDIRDVVSNLALDRKYLTGYSKTIPTEEGRDFLAQVNLG